MKRVGRHILMGGAIAAVLTLLILNWLYAAAIDTQTRQNAIDLETLTRQIASTRILAAAESLEESADSRFWTAAEAIVRELAEIRKLLEDRP